MSEHGLAFDVMVYLAAAVVCVPLAKRLGLGSVLGYLAAGCAIGPWGLGFVGDVESTMHFSEFGVVLMLFVIGLELEPERLRAMRREVLRGGTLQVAACAAPLVLAGLAVGLPWRGAAVAAVALALSSTAIVMTTLAERSLTNTTVGRTSFAILLFQDIAAIPLLVVIPLLAAGADAAIGWEGPAMGFLAVGAVVVLGRYVTPPIMRRVASLRQREVFTAFALLLVLGIAQLMSAVGVSMGLGAFLAGVLLAGSEYRHALESDLEPFRGLLMGLFFIAVGMTVDFGLLTHEPLVVLGMVVGFSALKLATLRAIAGRVGVPARQRWLLAVLLSQGGEFAFVVFGAARQARLLPGNWDAILTLTVALSMALMPILLIAHDRLFANASEAKPAAPEAIESEDAPVIIAGFGRFGQIVGRLLFASGLRATVLDHDADQIEFLKRFGFRVFYGDARRHDLMHAAGAAKAKVLVIAVDDADACLQIADMARHEFSHLRIVARARNVQAWFELRRRGIALIERELFEASIAAGRRTLELLDVGRHEAFERAATFRRHNVAMLEQLLPHLDDEVRRISVAKAAREDLERQFEREHQQLVRHAAHGWHHPEDEPPR
jgi:glutathione-regulated potassium-efflux system ancillary protein KefC